MRLLIVTVAGIARRFNASVDSKKKIIKCLYNEGNMKRSLLYRLFHNFPDMDKYIIVGGYEFGELKKTLDRENCFEEYRERMTLVNNEDYEKYGSGYSLYKGLEEALKYDAHEIIFAEGDLYVDRESCERISKAGKNILTVNNDPILASKAVALYMDTQGRVHYIYDTEHGTLQINQPFTAIFNSGQIWKFVDGDRVRRVFNKLSESRWQNTNLEYIQEYFGELSGHEYEVVPFCNWINCNTIDDYRKISELEGNNEVYE
ncbi:MAG: hypothetical protein K5989_05150 [Lachnospiraceae bacterium]|nr:hypothetical protein [Lachnospiraceae bacterium]